MEFPGYDSREQGHILGHLVQAGDARGAGNGRAFEANLLAVQDGYYDYWMEQTYGSFTLERVVPSHGARTTPCIATRSTSTCSGFWKEQLPMVGWLTDENKDAGQATPGEAGIADAVKVLGAPRPGPWGVMAEQMGAKLPAVARGYFQLVYLTAHPANEIGVRTTKDSQRWRR